VGDSERERQWATARETDRESDIAVRETLGAFPNGLSLLISPFAAKIALIAGLPLQFLCPP